MGGLLLRPRQGHELAVVALETVHVQPQVGAEVDAMNQRQAGVGEVLQRKIKTVMATPAVGQQRMGMALAGLHRQPGPAQTMDPVQIVEVVQALVDDHRHARAATS